MVGMDLLGGAIFHNKEKKGRVIDSNLSITANTQ